MSWSSRYACLVSCCSTDDAESQLMFICAHAAPLSPSKEEFIQASQRHASLSLRSWKSGGCELLDFTVKLRQGAAQAWTTVAEGLPANQTQLLLRNLTPGATYHVHVVARSTAGATEAQYEFTTPNGTARE